MICTYIYIPDHTNMHRIAEKASIVIIYTLYSISIYPVSIWEYMEDIVYPWGI